MRWHSRIPLEAEQFGRHCKYDLMFNFMLNQKSIANCNNILLLDQTVQFILAVNKSLITESIEKNKSKNM